MPAVHDEQFTEDLYFVLRSAPMRDRLEALGRKHGLDNITLWIEVMRYVARLGTLHRAATRGAAPAKRGPLGEWPAHPAVLAACDGRHEQRFAGTAAGRRPARAGG